MLLNRPVDADMFVQFFFHQLKLIVMKAIFSFAMVLLAANCIRAQQPCSITPTPVFSTCGEVTCDGGHAARFSRIKNQRRL